MGVEMEIISKISKELGLAEKRVSAAVKLMDEGNTLPFIARYRKEVTEMLTDTELRDIDSKLKSYRNLEKRREEIIVSIESQEAMTDKLMQAIKTAKTLSKLEDLYLPYKKKRNTRAEKAKKMGLEPLALKIYNLESRDLKKDAEDFINTELGVDSSEFALQGASDIIAEMVSDNSDVRGVLRKYIEDFGLIVSKSIGEEIVEGTYDQYSDFSQRIKDIPSYRVLAINRGAKEGALKTSVKVDDGVALNKIDKIIIYGESAPLSNSDGLKDLKNNDYAVNLDNLDSLFGGVVSNKSSRKKNENVKKKVLNLDKNSGQNSFSERENRLKSASQECLEFIRNACQDAYKRLIFPSLENEAFTNSFESASEQAIKVFGLNLKPLLMQAPLTGKIVLGFDPGYRTGCKIAVVDSRGKLLDTCVVYPTPPKNKTVEAEKTLTALIKRYGVNLIAIGNGTATKESEIFVADLISKIKSSDIKTKANLDEGSSLVDKFELNYVIVNEAGASVYSASPLGAEEFPQLDVSLRSAVSIARRIQDPLAELVKIEPKSIGVGQYQHDMPQKRLSEVLQGVVEDSVNSVGVDVNTASASLLSYIAGIGPSLAKNIVAYRDEIGGFANRREFLKVPKLGKKTFEQCAGFMRVSGGKEFLDSTAVHPESYKQTKKIIDLCGYTADIKAVKNNKKETLRNILASNNLEVNDNMNVTDNRGANFRIENIFKDIDERIKTYGKAKLVQDSGLGIITLKDIVSELKKPGRDPRESVQGIQLRSEILSAEDLQLGTVIEGTVRNVVDFGVFVDIGVHQDGLVHISKICDKFIKHPSEVLKVGDIVKVKVEEVDTKRNRISLSMREV